MNHQLVTGVKFDANGTLWLLNSQAPTKAMIKYSNGTFTSVPQPVLMKLDEAPFKNKSNGFMCNMMIDREGYMWFVNDNWALAALYRYNISTNTITAYEKIVNQDGIAIQNLYHVTSVVEDLENNIWIGTDQGPFMLERARIENGESIFTQVKVPRNDGTNYADYLLSGIYIHDIVVDAAGRKWFATDGNGVYLISADNMTQLQHFTVENSNLLSNTVLDIDINNETGEVFFGAANGLCSYMSDATTTYDEMTKDNVWAYPNPVTPDYQGLITVVGLTLNADVKILASNGALVAEGRSSGGTFTWNGCDKNGDPAASIWWLRPKPTAARVRYVRLLSSDEPQAIHIQALEYRYHPIPFTCHAICHIAYSAYTRRLGRNHQARLRPILRQGALLFLRLPLAPIRHLDRIYSRPQPTGAIPTIQSYSRSRRACAVFADCL